MLSISNDARKRRQNVYVYLQSIYASEPETYQKIWDLVLSHEKENRFDSALTFKILSSLNGSEERLKEYLREVLENPELLNQLRKPRMNSDPPPVNALAEKLKQIRINNAHLEHPITLAYTERLRSVFEIKKYEEWYTVSPKKDRVDDEDKYCDPDLAKHIVIEKEDMGNYTEKQKHIMRQTANKYEKIKGAFFQNREAMKLAALDRMFDFGLTMESDQKSRTAKNPMNGESGTNAYSRDENTFYFADVGGGPGAHAEFILWRKGYYNAKGFGCTMKSKYPKQPHYMGDYEKKDFVAGSFAFFDTYYGVKGNGDICDPENLKSFEKYVKDRTDGKGVHLVVGDAAVDPDGRETRQELFHNRIFLGEFIAALSLCRIDEGNFVCKLYDTVTPFTVGLIYLMWVAFDQIAICKPVSVRPACSEKFLVCRKLTNFGATVIKNYLSHVNEQFDKLPDGMDITQVVPKVMLDLDTRFMMFIMEHNRKVFIAQIESLKFYKSCLKDSSLAPKNQNEVRVQVLKDWGIPDIPRAVVKEFEHISQIFECYSGGFDLKQFYYLFAYDPQKIFRIVPKLKNTQVVLSEYFIQMLKSGTQKILMSDDRGYIHILEPQNSKIKAIKNSDYHGFPPRSIVLIQHNKENFGPDAQNYPIRIVDAAVLAGDNISYMALLTRLEYAKKFADNTVFRFNGKRIPLEVTSARPLDVYQIKNLAKFDHGYLKISRIFTKQYNVVWNKDIPGEQIVHTPSMEILEQEMKYRSWASFWDNLASACKVSDWRNARFGFLDTVVGIHREYCTRNNISFDDEDD